MNQSHKSKTETIHIVFGALGGLVLLFVLAPLASIFMNCSFTEMLSAARESEITDSIWLTLWTSMTITVGFALAAVPFAYLLARKEFPGKQIITGIIDLPIVVPHSAAGIALLNVLSRSSPAGKVAETLGFSFVGSSAGIMMAMAFVSLPYLVNAARDGFAAVPERLEKAALNLGASPTRVFFTISLPLARRAIVSGLVLLWARGMSEFGAVLVLAYHPMTTPVLIFERFGAFGLDYARPVVAIFLVVCLAFFVTLRLLARRK